MTKKILFIDNEKTLCKKIKQFLSKKGFKVTTALDGEKGIELLKKEPFQLVITDLMMSGVSGLDVLAFVKEYAPQTLTLVLTGYATLETATEALRQGVYDYILKPFDCNHLLITINRSFEVLELKEAKQKAEEKLKKLTITDELTGLFNQRNFYTVLTNEINRTTRYSKSLSLLFIEIDHFKDYHNIYGETEGYAVLKTFGQILTMCTRKMDICYRYEGEKFSIILTETGETEALIVAERIRKTFQDARFCVKDQESQLKNYLTVSIGLAEYKNTLSIEQMIQLAESMLNNAKKSGENTVHYQKKIYSSENVREKPWQESRA